MEDRPRQVDTLDMDQPTPQPQHLIAVDQPLLQAKEPKEQPNMGLQEHQEHQEHPSPIQDTSQANDR